MADCLFSRSQLEKHGWTEGVGLGKFENGIINPIKVDRKNNRDGIGHIPGNELTKNWWDQAYNNAAKQISVETTKEGVVFHQKTTETKEIKTKSLLYARFVKGATLKASKGMTIEESEESSESDNEKEQIPPRLSDEEIFKICGGRTAHKAAGHGLKQNGKLQRIQEQELKYLESINKKTDIVSGLHIAETKKGKKRKKDSGEKQEDFQVEEMKACPPPELEDRKKTKRKIREEIIQAEDKTEMVESRKKRKNCHDEKESRKESEEENDKEEKQKIENIQSVNDGKFEELEMQEEKSVEETERMRGRKKKKMKKKHYGESEEPEESRDEIDEERLGMDELEKEQEIRESLEMSNEVNRKKKHKKKKEEVDKSEIREEEEGGEEEEESTRSKKKKKKKKRIQEGEDETEHKDNPSGNKSPDGIEPDEQENKETLQTKQKNSNKKEKKRKKKNLVENKMSSQMNGSLVRNGTYETPFDRQKSGKVDIRQKKVCFSPELVTVFTFNNEEILADEQVPPTQKKKKTKHQTLKKKKKH